MAKDHSNRQRHGESVNKKLSHFFFVLAIMTSLVSAGCSHGEVAKQVATDQPIVKNTPMLELDGLIATKDLSVGSNRISFLLTSPNALVTAPSANVNSVFLGTPEVVKESVVAQFFLWPFGSRGSYVTEMSFDRSGDWRLDVDVQQHDGSIDSALIWLSIAETSVVPALGSKPPMIANKTSREVSELKALTTRPIPDPDLYELTIEEALETKKPLMIVFASPAFCSSPTCGPQVETVEALKDQYKSRANFIHVEIYDNPEKIQGNISQAQFAPIIERWGFTQLRDYSNGSWVFIIDSDGNIASKYEGYAVQEELQNGLEDVLYPENDGSKSEYIDQIRGG